MLPAVFPTYTFRLLSPTFMRPIVAVLTEIESMFDKLNVVENTPVAEFHVYTGRNA
jgi:hypothetical protein